MQSIFYNKYNIVILKRGMKTLLHFSFFQYGNLAGEGVDFCIDQAVREVNSVFQPF
jgi:hypothetical protein